jgi:hypothetical protein
MKNAAIERHETLLRRNKALKANLKNIINTIIRHEDKLKENFNLDSVILIYYIRD